MLLSRTKSDRPRVVHHETTNLAFIGQFVEIPDDTTYSFEYSVRGAQMAVCTLLDLGHVSMQIRKNRLLEVFGFVGVSTGVNIIELFRLVAFCIVLTKVNLLLSNFGFKELFYLSIPIIM